MRHHRRQSRLQWVCAAVAPWALGAGLLVSFTASAGHEVQGGASVAPRLADPALDLSILVPPSTAQASVGLPGLSLGAILEAEPPRIMPLRPHRKREADGPDTAERARKGDPAAPVRASLSRQGADLGRTARRAPRLMFGTSARALPPTLLLPGPAEPSDLEAEQGFVPLAADEATTTREAAADSSPSVPSAGSTGASRPGSAISLDGSTPAVPRAVALSSTTPAAAEATPIEIAAAPVSLPSGPMSRIERGPAPAVALAPKPDGESRPRYADLISPDRLEREQRCLAEAVYFEARSEPEAGQAAVAQVVLNRVQSGLYPASICGVVYQNRHRHLACQFTFACEGKSLRVTDGESWRTASRVAKAVLDGTTYLAEVGGATHYHADYVRPSWARRLKKMDVIGRHIFYKLKPGQT